MIDVVEATVEGLRRALASGATTSVEIVQAHLDRIVAYDRIGTATSLNAVVVDNPDALDEAREADERRRSGHVRGPLDGIPYTAKNSFLVRGLTAAAGSPAFEALVARRDAFAVERLRAAGAVCLGLTNMPPMADGEMQRGLYGRAESPYNGDYLTAPLVSGSSNGSGTATAASFALFGLAEETWSSGRGPASHNGLCAYTPSRGLISVRGNWPLVPTMDVVVPHTRTMADLLEVLEVLVVDDPDVRGDLWRAQPWVPLPRPSQVRPESYAALACPDRLTAVRRLAGSRVGVPRMYIGADPVAGTGVGIGGPTGKRIETRTSVLELWRSLRRQLESCGVQVVEVDFPPVSNYEGDRAGVPTIRSRGLVPPAFLDAELLELAASAWEDFLAVNGDPRLSSVVDVDKDLIFPVPVDAVTGFDSGSGSALADYPQWVRDHPGWTWEELPELADGLRGLERTRRTDLEEWMDGLGLDAVVFPAVADVAPAAADVDLGSARLAWRNGVWVANGNLAMRHLGIPTVTVPMGTMPDTGMPVGLTIAGRAYDDSTLLAFGAAVEALAPRRTPPRRTPPLC